MRAILEMFADYSGFVSKCARRAHRRTPAKIRRRIPVERSTGVGPSELQAGLYSSVIQVIGIWSNNDTCGLTIRAKKLVRTGDSAKRFSSAIAPEDVEFADVPAEFA